MKRPILEIKNLSLHISQKPILQNISLSIYEGESISIIGPNGAGKTSLLKCLLQIYTHYKGEIFLMGHSVKNMTHKKIAQYLSYVPQGNEHLFPYTVEQLVMMGRYPYLSPFSTLKTKDKQAVEQALTLTQMNNFADRPLDTLSGGERQIVFIAAALAQGANVILLDEPTSFLDPKHTNDIHNILNTLNKKMGITIISITHDINSAALHSDRIIILKAGNLKFNGPPKDMMQNKTLEPAFEKPFTFVDHPISGQRIIAPEVL